MVEPIKLFIVEGENRDYCFTANSITNIILLSNRNFNSNLKVFIFQCIKEVQNKV